jgi:hypothetical protein
MAPGGVDPTSNDGWGSGGYPDATGYPRHQANPTSPQDHPGAETRRRRLCLKASPQSTGSLLSAAGSSVSESISRSAVPRS